MVDNTFQSDVEALEREFASRRDGGYDLALELTGRLRRLDDSARQAARSWLLRLVEERDGSRWRLALAVLTEDGASETGPSLAAMLDGRSEPHDWADAITVSLLKIRYAPALDLCWRYALSRLSDGDSGAFNLLAMFYAPALDRALAAASGFLSRSLGGDLGGVAVGPNVIANHVHKLARIGDGAVLDLVKKTYDLSPDAGEELRRRFSEYLRKPLFFDDVLTERRAKQLVGALERVSLQ